MMTPVQEQATIFQQWFEWVVIMGWLVAIFVRLGEILKELKKRNGEG